LVFFNNVFVDMSWYQ